VDLFEHTETQICISYNYLTQSNPSIRWARHYISFY